MGAAYGTAKSGVGISGKLLNLNLFFIININRNGSFKTRIDHEIHRNHSKYLLF